MATHSSVLAWRIPGPGEPGGLPSMGSYPERTWVKVRARVSHEEFAEYGGRGIVLHAESVVQTAQPDEPVINFAG